jgi:hypothetical protein
MWAAGTAGAGAITVSTGGVQAGFNRLSSLVAAFVGLFVAAGEIPMMIGVGLAVLASLVARRTRLVGGLLALSSLSMLVTASTTGSPAAAVTGAAALGGVTGALLLGHWYLVDPRLPRRLLVRLNTIGLVGLIADVLVLAVLGAMSGGSSEALAPTWVSGVLTAFTATLILAVWGALRGPSYSAVMAATGLAYLAVITCLAAVTVGRSLVV